MIKIAYIIDTVYSPVGGTERQLLLLLKHLDRCRFTPVLCTLTLSTWLDKHFDVCPLHVSGITSFKRVDTWIKIWRLSRFLKEGHIDIVQTFFSDANKVGIIAAKLAGVPLVISSRRNQGYWHTKAELAQIKILNHWVDLFIANSFSTKEWVNVVEGVAEEQIKVAYNGIDLSLFDADSRSQRVQYRKMLGIEDHVISVCMVANYRPIKGYEVFLRAAKVVAEQTSNVVFFAVGDFDEQDGYYSNLRELTKQLELEDRFIFLGPRSDVALILQAIDIGVMSSNSESFSNALGEYLAAGLPVVSTDVGGARESISSGENGYIVPVGDYQALGEKILEVISREDCVVMGKASRERADRFFSLSSMVRRHQEIYLSGLQHEKN
jgi:glycosyltransferase involved in cell wall biosynthesis